MSTLTLSDDQQQALDALLRFARDPDPAAPRELALGGLAGTGKTTLVDALLAHLPGTRVLAPTAKACAVLLGRGVSAQTVHSAIYDFRGVRVDEGREVLEFDEKGKALAHPLVVVDEASMVSLEVAAALRRAVPGRLVWVGDHGQLPPVGDDAGLLARPDVRLERIHRQVAGSPILALAHAVRAGAPLVQACLEHRGDGSVLRAYSYHDAADALRLAGDADVVLCGRNETRRALNQAAWDRARAADPALPAATFPSPRGLAAAHRVPLVALKSSYRAGLLNGEVVQLERARRPERGGPYELDVVDALQQARTLRCCAATLGRGVDGRGAEVLEAGELDEDLCFVDYGWALTVHKAQGSQWPHVAVVDEARYWRGDAARWAYTAATRAAERLTVLTPRR